VSRRPGRDAPQVVLLHDPDALARGEVRARLDEGRGLVLEEAHERAAFLAALENAGGRVVLVGIGDEAALERVRDVVLRAPERRTVALVAAGRDDLGERALALGAEEWIPLDDDGLAALPEIARSVARRVLLATVLDAVEAYVVVMDPALRVLRWNERCAAVVGRALDADERRWSALVHPEDLPRVEHLRDEVLAGRHARCELRLRARSGEVRAVVWHVEAVRGAGGGARHVVATGVDVTDQRRAEHHNAQLEVELRHAQRMEAIGVLAGGVAHDFSNLLTAIYGHTDLAKATLPADHAAIRSLELVEEAAQSAEGVCRALLTFTQKGRAGKEMVDVVDVVARSTRLLHRLLPASIEFVEEVDPAASYQVRGDATQLQQVLMNLVVNARDAMPEGGLLRLVVRHERSRDGFGEVVIEVRDSGHGMDDATRARVFEPFFTTKPRERGSGLGLSVLLGIVADHEGTVDVASEVGAGTTFTVRLPLAAPVERDGGADAGPPPEAGVVLVAAHDTYVRTIVASSLRAAGYAVVACANARETAAAFVREQGGVRLAVLDCDLPPAGAGAREVLAPIRERAARLPILILCADEDAGSPLEGGTAVRRLRKPFPMTELLSTVEEMLGSLSCTAPE